MERGGVVVRRVVEKGVEGEGSSGGAELLFPAADVMKPGSRRKRESCDCHMTLSTGILYSLV